MKTISQSLCIALVFALLLCAGCKKDLFLELPFGSTDTIITKEINNIEFKFYLQNELNKSSTVFNQGENFTFHFSFTNKGSDSITVTTEFINSDFFRVYKKEEQNFIDMGRPYSGVWCFYRLEPQEFNLSKNESKMLYIPWVADGDPWDETTYPLCPANDKSFLPQGKYYTAFNLDFHYIIIGKKKTINNATFKINFEIK